MPTIRFRLVEGIHVSVSSTENVTDPEWHAYIDDIGRCLPEMTGLLSYSEGAAPTPTQRLAINRFWDAQAKKVPLAIITTSKVVKIMVTAFSWMMGERIRGFGTVEEGLDYLKLEPARRLPVIATVKELLVSVRHSRG